MCRYLLIFFRSSQSWSSVCVCACFAEGSSAYGWNSSKKKTNTTWLWFERDDCAWYHRPFLLYSMQVTHVSDTYYVVCSLCIILLWFFFWRYVMCTQTYVVHTTYVSNAFARWLVQSPACLPSAEPFVLIIVYGKHANFWRTQDRSFACSLSRPLLIDFIHIFFLFSNERSTGQFQTDLTRNEEKTSRKCDLSCVGRKATVHRLNENNKNQFPAFERHISYML